MKKTIFLDGFYYFNDSFFISLPVFGCLVFLIK
ncbi:Hypothetical Protein SLY_0232 [Strawberry lethal yellows phytoplasma (CPA) str. NZSb11]|uniref:Uncharacterized protein n=1 Tax=Strawberry lethal yellows phytoplasma (CPA) str. NZSb11 TaxID=980422 RepID=R4S027_PHYAS|nr:Hypothetical Protein SLY_0232 [Strawberry lethal yellows phytoplasma (CPA) str. NZSb11]